MTSTWWSRLTSEDKSDDEMNTGKYTIYLERLFKIRDRNTSIAREIKCGCSHFFSCAFILAVNPSLLQYAGFDPDRVAAGTAISAGFGCIISGLLSNLPFVLAPTTSTSLYFALFIQNRNLHTKDGDFAVFVLGLLLFLCGLRPVALFISNIIPFVIKVGICLGVGLLIALESLTEIGLVKTGDRTVLDIGEFSVEIYIAMVAFITIGIALHYRIRGAFLLGLVLGTVLYWLLQLADRHGHTNVKYSDVFVGSGDLELSFAAFSTSTISCSAVYRLVFDLYIIGVILLNGLAHGLSEMAGLKREDGTLPRGKWLYAACGLGTLLSSLLGSGPIMISPESAPGIKSGARTGLSAVVCGILFLMSTIFCPLFAKVPAAGTSPVLLMIGMMLFENAGKVDWARVKEALPVFVMSVFIPFTYSIFNGVVFGLGVHCILYVTTEENALPRIGKLLGKIAGSCCGSGTVNSNSSGSSNSRNNTSSRTVGAEYRNVLQEFDSNEDRADPRGLSFELSEISNQYVGAATDDDLVSIRFSSVSSTGSATAGGNSTYTGRNTLPVHTTTTSTRDESSTGSYLQNISNFWKSSLTADRERYRSVNAGAGSLLSLIGSSSGRDDNNTPDWVLENNVANKL